MKVSLSIVLATLALIIPVASAQEVKSSPETPAARNPDVKAISSVYQICTKNDELKKAFDSSIEDLLRNPTKASRDVAWRRSSMYQSWLMRDSVTQVAALRFEHPSGGFELISALLCFLELESKRLTSNTFSSIRIASNTSLPVDVRRLQLKVLKERSAQGEKQVTDRLSAALKPFLK